MSIPVSDSFYRNSNSYGVDGKPSAKWLLTNAWPAKLTCDSDNNGMAAETVVLVCDSIERVKP